MTESVGGLELRIAQFRPCSFDTHIAASAAAKSVRGVEVSSPKDVTLNDAVIPSTPLDALRCSIRADTLHKDQRDARSVHGDVAERKAERGALTQR